MKRFLAGFAALLALLWLAAGPRPADNGHYRQSDYYHAALSALDQTPPRRAKGPLRAGIAEVEITPPLGHPLAGYGARRPKAASGRDSPCHARALSLAVGGETVTLLTADILLADQPLVDAVLTLTGLRPDQIYVTASHTHSGPGGHARGLVMEQVFGDFDPDYFQRLASKLAELVRASRDGLQPAEFALVQQQLPGWQDNRIDSGAPTHDPLSLLMFRVRGDEQPLALLAVFGAHATVLNSDNRLASADYPGHLVERLRQGSNARMALFAAGAVGDARPRAHAGKDDQERALLYGQGLAEAVLPALAGAQWQAEVELASLNLALELPPARIPLGSDWTLGPLLSWLVVDRPARLSALRLGDTLLAGFPGDYAGHLAELLSQQASAQAGGPLATVATSFSGGYEGYLVSSDWFFKASGYETRQVNFFGPWAGDYVNEMALAMARRLFQAED